MFYAHLFLLKSNANGVSREDIINRLGITETFINEFLQGKVAVDLDFAKKTWRYYWHTSRLNRPDFSRHLIAL